MEPKLTTPSSQEPPAKNRYKKYALLSIPTSTIILLLLVLSFFLRSDTSNPQSTPSPAVSSPTLNPPKVELALFAQGLPSPTAIIANSGGKGLYVLDQSGIIRLVNADGSVKAEPFLDIRSRVLSGGEMGLLGLAFSPNHSQDGYLFINYIDKNQNTVIARYQRTAADKADPDSEQKVLIIAQPYKNHNGGAVVFGEDGYLYAALGDGGSGGDPQNRAQDLSTLLGKILRLDVSQLPYKIPATNPFVNQPDKRGEIWDFGLRNPWRLSFDRQTKELYIADVGQGDYEEINLEPSGQGGKNYGWRCYEGEHDFNLGGCGPKDQYVFPALEYDHSEDRCSVTGGYTYRGQKYQALTGKYFYGDFCGGQVYFAEKKSGKLESTLITKSSYQISTFGEDSQGELYLADYATGNIYRIVDSAN